MKKEVKKLCLILGILLLLSAIVGVLVSVWLDSEAERACEDAVRTIDQIFPNPRDAFPEEGRSDAMPSMQIAGMDVLGILELSRNDCRLPLGAQKHALGAGTHPWRIRGGIHTRDLILGASAEAGQLSFAEEMEVGDPLSLIDVKGARYSYQLSAVRHAASLDPEKIDKTAFDLLIAVKKGNAYLLLYFAVQ